MLKSNNFVQKINFPFRQHIFVSVYKNEFSAIYYMLTWHSSNSQQYVKHGHMTQ